MQESIATWQRWRLGAGASIWRQPALIGDPLEIDPTRSHLGLQVHGRAERPLIPVWFGSGRASVIVDVAGKTRGFVPGEPLDSGVSVRGGIGLPF
jgi:hypothetical protein